MCFLCCKYAVSKTKSLLNLSKIHTIILIIGYFKVYFTEKSALFDKLVVLEQNGVAAVEATIGTEEVKEGPIKPKVSWWKVTKV